MAKKTLSDLKRCPIDFLYLWASDDFISKLGSKAKIIKQKKYNQYQTLYKIVVENVNKDSAAEYIEVYKEWANELAKAIKDTYGYTPDEILVKLAMGETIAGKNYSQGVYGIGDSTQSTIFVQNRDYTVDVKDGKIYSNGKEVPNQVVIYGPSGLKAGYSCQVGDQQFQSTYVNAETGYRAFTFSNPNSVQTNTGQSFDSSQGTFWQNANNYMPLVDTVLNWVGTLVNSFFPNRLLLTQANTVPQQSEWVEPDTSNGSLLLVGGVLAAIAFFSNDKKKKNVKKDEQ